MMTVMVVMMMMMIVKDSEVCVRNQKSVKGLSFRENIA